MGSRHSKATREADARLQLAREAERRVLEEKRKLLALKRQLTEMQAQPESESDPIRKSAVDVDQLLGYAAPIRMRPSNEESIILVDNFMSTSQPLVKAETTISLDSDMQTLEVRSSSIESASPEFDYEASPGAPGRASTVKLQMVPNVVKSPPRGKTVKTKKPAVVKSPPGKTVKTKPPRSGFRQSKPFLVSRKGTNAKNRWGKVKSTGVKKKGAPKPCNILDLDQRVEALQRRKHKLVQKLEEKYLGDFDSPAVTKINKQITTLNRRIATINMSRYDLRKSRCSAQLMS